MPIKFYWTYTEIQTNLFISPDCCLFLRCNIFFNFEDLYPCPIEIIKGLTDKEQLQYLTKLKGTEEGTYLYTTQFLSLR